MQLSANNHGLRRRVHPSLTSHVAVGKLLTIQDLSFLICTGGDNSAVFRGIGDISEELSVAPDVC